MLVRAGFWCLLAVGCVGDGGSDTGSNSDTGSDTGSSGGLLDGLGPDDGCNEFDGTPVNAATDYFAGEYNLDGSNLSGREYWALFANPTWQENGGYDCTMVWDVTGTTEACAGCDLLLNVTAAFNAGVSDCPAELEAIEGADFTVSYEATNNGGQSVVSFTSGTVLGTGDYSASRITWLSNQGCSYF